MRFVLVALLYPFLLPAQRTIPIDNDQVRVLFVVDPPNRPAGRMHEHTMNRVMIYLDEGAQKITYQEGHVQDLKFRAGEAIWSPASGMHTSQNVSGKPYRIVEIELKGQPRSSAPLVPTTHKLELDNAQVRITRAHLKAKEKTALHDHSLNRVVVSLNSPEDGIRFLPAGRQQEENPGDTPLDLILVEIK